MTQEQIKSIFSQGYNRTNWKKFLSEAFPGAEILQSPQPLLGIDTHIAKSAYQLGQIAIRENGIERSIAVFEVTLADGIVLERNRVGLRNLLRRYWKDLDAAFIAYTKSDSQRWRFTYVSELTGYDAEGEAINIKTEPKRYTYVLGEGESIRTACERFASIAAKGSKATLDDVKEAFSVEKLSKSFFDEYKKQYAEFCRYMIAKPNINAALFNGDEKAIRDFNKKLLGRIVFLYFIQKKGWLGVPVRSEWGQGDYNFLTHQFENFRNKDLFYRDFLSVLFFETLNCKRGDDLFNYDNTKFINKPENDLVKIPYLNGGLFEEENIKHRELIVDAELFRSLFDFFNQYNFTIYEDDPNDHTVAVDPEMLGHIFENLLEDNKDKGAFYTPKEIVHYMCQESLIEYLCTTLKIEDEAKEREAITNLLKKKEIDEILKPEIQNINHALDAVKICDPAIGSGAFPMGLLHEIFTAKQTLYAFEAGNSIGFDASGTKLNIIQNSIYGVDIEKGAVDIARLRFWLSLIVDESEPKPLPNLDYKIVVGNSLVSKFGDDILEIDWNLNATSQENIFGSSDIRDEKARIIKQIIKEQKEFFNPTGDKKTLAADVRNLKIDLLINQLQLMAKTKGLSKMPDGLKGKALKEATELFLQTKSWKQSIAELTKLKSQPDKALEFFDWKLDFPEIMNENVNPNTGFDIVIGNPPYVSNQNMTTEIKQQYINYTCAKHQFDLYHLFIERGMSNLISKGILVFIHPTSFVLSDSSKNLRKLILCNYQLNKAIVLGDTIFEHAVVSTMISSIKKTASNDYSISFGNVISVIEIDNMNFSNISKEFCISDNFRININLTSPFFSILLQKIESDTIPLSNITHSGRGLEGSEFSKKKALKIQEGTIPFIFGENISKYMLKFSYYLPLNSNYGSKTELFEKNSIVMMMIWTGDLIAAINQDGYPCSGQSTYCISSNESKDYPNKALLSIINSSLMSFYYKVKYHKGKDIFPKMFLNEIRSLPIKTYRFDSYKSIVTSIVDIILAKKEKGEDTKIEENKIDRMVYKLYELTYEEVKIIDPEFDTVLERFGLSPAAFDLMSIEELAEIDIKDEE